MHIRGLPLLRARGAALVGQIGLVSSLLTCPACGAERSPWYGFDLVPREQTTDASVPDTAEVATSSADALGSQTANVGTSRAAESPAGNGVANTLPNTTTSPPTNVAVGQAGAPAAAGSINGSEVPATATATGEPSPATQAPAPITAFRITELELRDPHVFAGTTDLTEAEVLGQSVNKTLIPAKLTKDSDGDGALDVSVVALLQPFDASAAPETIASLRLVNASCPLNAGSPCKPPASTGGLDAKWTLEQRPSGKCLEPIAGTTSNYQPALGIPSGPCFLTKEGNDLTLDVGGIKIKVIAARVSATYQAQPAALTQGLLAGFVTRRAAMQATLPAAPGTPGGDALSNYIRARDYDQSASPNGEDGFWMYMNFVAKPIDYQP